MSLKSLSTALSLLDYFTPETPKWGVRGLAKACGQHPAVVQRMLATYTEHGFLLRSGAPKTQYCLGLRFYQLGGMVSGVMSFIEVVTPILQTLALSSGETAYLNWLSRDDCICIAIGESPNTIQLRVNTGSHMPLYAGAASKVILAHMSASHFAVWAQRQQGNTSETAWDATALWQECEVIRQAGYAFTKGEWVRESFGLAVPIWGKDGALFGSLALAGPAYRFDEQRIAGCIEEMTLAQGLVRQALRHFG
ncbi:IclR family transcriptional regulator [Serratia quinivorans]|jgi:DNA-binding IclR family transcriptional regulator|uniref:IclR family transcriptional regulator n=1 Tax=Serratia quinivorans TaxID=137545 RepID=UPI0021795E1A|nr:IclR family transcriptional regulator [Serratia quinivorans]CAI1102747.1 Acetate operon repressor [Serratia quinivorans]